MSRKSGFGGFGYGFGGPTPLLRRIFRENRLTVEALRPEQEKLVMACVDEIKSDDLNEKELADVLRKLLHDSEAAEGEDPKEIDK